MISSFISSMSTKKSKQLTPKVWPFGGENVVLKWTQVKRYLLWDICGHAPTDHLLSTATRGAFEECWCSFTRQEAHSWLARGSGCMTLSRCCRFLSLKRNSVYDVKRGHFSLSYKLLDISPTGTFTVKMSLHAPLLQSVPFNTLQPRHPCAISEPPHYVVLCILHFLALNMHSHWRESHLQRFLCDSQSPQTLRSTCIRLSFLSGWVVKDTTMHQ